MWTPVTGRIEPGESVGAAAAREVREETGLAVRAGRVLQRSPTEGPAPRFLLAWVEASPMDERAALAPLSLDEREVAEARWVTAEEALALHPMFATTREFFARVAAAGSTPTPETPPRSARAARPSPPRGPGPPPRS